MVEHKLHKKFREYQKSVLGIKRKLNRLTFIENNFRCNPQKGIQNYIFKNFNAFWQIFKAQIFCLFYS